MKKIILIKTINDVENEKYIDEFMKKFLKRSK